MDIPVEGKSVDFADRLGEGGDGKRMDDVGKGKTEEEIWVVTTVEGHLGSNVEK